MSLEAEHLECAVRLLARSDSPQRAAATDPTRLSDDFRTAYRAVTDASAGATPWDARLLDAAWEIVRAAHPAGATLETLLATCAAAYAAVGAAPPERQDPRSRPRRDA
jgi:hypothetical protein